MLERCWNDAATMVHWRSAQHTPSMCNLPPRGDCARCAVMAHRWTVLAMPINTGRVSHAFGRCRQCQLVVLSQCHDFVIGHFASQYDRGVFDNFAIIGLELNLVGDHPDAHPEHRHDAVLKRPCRCFEPGIVVSLPVHLQKYDLIQQQHCRRPIAAERLPFYDLNVQLIRAEVGRWPEIEVEKDLLRQYDRTCRLCRLGR